MKIKLFLFTLIFVSQISYAEDIKVGVIAPDFSLNSISGEKVNFKDFKGKIVFLNFFATWCGPCRAETPDLVKVYSLYKEKVVFISVNLQEDKEKVLEFIDEYKVTWKILLDSAGKVGDLYNIRGIPTNLILDKNCKITFLGHFLTSDVLKKELDKVLSK